MNSWTSATIVWLPPIEPIRIPSNPSDFCVFFSLKRGWCACAHVRGVVRVKQTTGIENKMAEPDPMRPAPENRVIAFWKVKRKKEKKHPIGENKTRGTLFCCSVPVQEKSLKINKKK